jgi:hypothetical protein
VGGCGLEGGTGGAEGERELVDGRWVLCGSKIVVLLEADDGVGHGEEYY